MKKSYQYTLVFMILVASVFTAILATAQTTMKPIILDNRLVAEQRAILEAFNLKPGSDDEVKKVFSSKIKPDVRTIKGQEIKGYRWEEGGEIKGYAIPFAGSALWGTVRGYLALNQNLGELLGITFTEQNETPGLGGRIDEAPYKEQWRGLKMPKGPLSYGPMGDQKIDAISGATLTSNSVMRILNELKTNVLSQWEVK
ncbi:Na(+)-translocating NADH-quinone reductase subunit C [Clostridiaceae bacterium JG1575]|nr:Na(+)-translocating NADH-quinone reductase subunit C [Clostridiaceae bacterium JG1575]